MNHSNISNPNPYPTKTNTPPHPTPYDFGKFNGRFQLLVAMAWHRRRHAMRKPSKWERPINFRKGHMGWGGVGVVFVSWVWVWV